SVCLRGENDPRYFTTQADATHFSACKGKIKSVNGLYEGMMDDAINIHGTYLKVIKRVDNNKLLGKYMHGQAWGFEWGRPGDKVQFIASKTMEIVGTTNKISAITAVDKPSTKGAKIFEITFEKPLDPTISEERIVGIENLTWTPEVLFANNTIRNNRARGALFSTPRKTIVENNLFDHTSGTAILLCGDCNGWFETGACKDMTIRNNKFINSLTNMFQFTNAVISIYPEIPDLKSQQKYFHSGIVIENNEFDTFDIPILYAKSVDGLIFRRNVIKKNHDYPAFHWNKRPFLFQRVKNATVSNNSFENGFEKGSPDNIQLK
ncbi:MAG: right-handed parallel beta-helix repeat-containing protein, partial [Bacteroidaceae bacterium]